MFIGALAQLVEQRPFKPRVTGSNPVRLTKISFYFNILVLYVVLYLFLESNYIMEKTYLALLDVEMDL